MFRAPTPEDQIDSSRIGAACLDRQPSEVVFELEHLRLENARLAAVLAKVFEEVREFPDSPPESSDSYLPPALVVEIAEALHQARAR